MVTSIKQKTRKTKTSTQLKSWTWRSSNTLLNLVNLPTTKLQSFPKSTTQTSSNLSRCSELPTTTTLSTNIVTVELLLNTLRKKENYHKHKHSRSLYNLEVLSLNSIQKTSFIEISNPLTSSFIMELSNWLISVSVSSYLKRTIWLKLW